MHDSFLELCVADAGPGFIETLSSSYTRRTGIPADQLLPSDVLAFAFDEFGTSKDREESWTTDRHALGRILQIVAKYGGALTLRSSGTEITYVSRGGRFERQYELPGYKPQFLRKWKEGLPGSQLQIILPLVPKIEVVRHRIRRSVLAGGLPTSFRPQPQHVRGHLVPLREVLDQPEACIGGEEQIRFRRKCQELCRNISEHRPRIEPIILDFSGVNWSPAQFETLLHLLQNVLQYRPALLVEIHPDLARGVIELERVSAPTELGTGLPEKKFMETYSSVDATILGLDQNGEKYIFGLRNRDYEEPLLRLIEEEVSIEELCKGRIGQDPLDENILRAILNHANPLFQLSGDRCWIIWDAQQLSNEATRVISRHFDEVAERSEAWRGRPTRRRDWEETDSVYEHKVRYYNLPWEKAWKNDFLECSRILSRGRHVDEIAQRLIYRLEYGLKIRGKSLDDVTVLAIVTAPAMLLATAIHRWWPNDNRPSVTDLGYYLMLGHPMHMPRIVANGGIIVVQDVLNTHTVSNRLVEVLKRQSLDVLGLLSFVHMNKEILQTRVTSISEGWQTEDIDGLPVHAMIEVPCPPTCEPPKDDELGEQAYWIEPRVLRPIKYTTLRREFQPGRDLDIERRDEYLQRLDDPTQGCLLAAGHYVYGRRHYSVAVDIHSALIGPIGKDISRWIADICEGLQASDAEITENNSRRKWETERGYNMRRRPNSDVSAVLMPLHSQIHYLWPQVETILAQRGRRQPMWLLDATLFSGRGPTYKIPFQLQHQIEAAVRSAVDAEIRGDKDTSYQLKILIIDDAIATARTAETIFATIQSAITKAFNEVTRMLPDRTTNIKSITNISPVRWIRYFSVLNQMNFARHQLWHNLQNIGKPNVEFIFEEFAPFMGMPVYDEGECPICNERLRLKRLIETCEQYGAEMAMQWASNRYVELSPVAIDGPGFQGAKPIPLPTEIDVLARSKTKSSNTSYLPRHTDTAIWRFYELMYLSYPPSNVLKSLEYAWPPSAANSPQVSEYERYRWAVLEWSLRNWPRLIADTATEQFLQAAIEEINRNTSLVERLLEAGSLQYQDKGIISLIANCVTSLARLERSRYDTRGDNLSDREDRVARLDTALTLFWLNVPSREWSNLPYDIEGKEVTLMSFIDSVAKPLDDFGISLLRNLHRRLARPQRYADPVWALTSVAELLFRGRDINNPAGRHHLLPRIINNVLRRPADIEDRQLLQSSLSLFLAALEDIIPYTSMGNDILDIGSLKEDGKQVLEWLSQCESSDELPPSLHHLEEALSREGEFCCAFDTLFHANVGSIPGLLRDVTGDINPPPDLKFEIEPNVNDCRVLTLVHRLIICLDNFVIDPMPQDGVRYSSCIKIRRENDALGKDWIVFRLLTNFASLATTQQRTNHGRNNKADLKMLAMFGATHDAEWSSPDVFEITEFTSAFEIRILAGFVTRGESQ